MSIPDSFIENILSQLQKETAFHRETVAEAMKLEEVLDEFLEQRPPEPELSPAGSPLRICGPVSALPDPHGTRQAAAVLAHSRIPFQILLQNHGCGPEYLICAASGREEAMAALQKSAMPGLRIAPCEPSNALPLRSYARISCLDLEPDREVCATWMKSLCNLSSKEHWAVSVDAVPVRPGDSWIRSRIQTAEDLYSRLSGLSRITLSVTHPIAADAASPGHKWQKSQEQGQYCVASHRQLQQADRSLCRIQNILRNLECLFRSGGWQIRILLHSRTPQLQQMLQDIMSSVFSAAGISIGWESAEDSPPYTLLTGPQFASLTACPPLYGPDRRAEDLHTVRLGCHLHHGATISIPAEQLQRPFGIFGCQQQTTAGTLRQILTGIKDRTYVLIDPSGHCCHGLDCEIYSAHPGYKNCLRINPFRFPEGGSLARHIHILTALLCAACRLDEQHSAVLEQCITRCYVNLGWNILTGRNYYSRILEEERLYPTFSHLAEQLSSVSDRTDQNIMLQIGRFTEGIPGEILNDPSAAPLTGLIPGRSIAVDLSGLISEPVRLVALGALLMWLPQLPDFPGRILVIPDADLMPDNPEWDNITEDILRRITEKNAGPLFTSRSVSRLPRYLAESMDGCVVHRISPREQRDDLNRFLRPEQGSPDLYSLESDLALVRYGSMPFGACVTVSVCPPPEENPCSAGVPVQQSKDLVRHILEISADLNCLMQDLMEPLYFQILFDQDRVSLSTALRENLFEPIRAALSHHTLVDILQDSAPETVILQLVQHSFSSYIRGQGILGYCLQNLMEMYVFRILRLTVQDRSLREADWTVLQDYRRNILDPRYREMILRSRGNLFEMICRHAGVYTHAELLVHILSDMYRYDPRNLTEVELSELVEYLSAGYLLRPTNPDRMRTGLVDPLYRCTQQDE